MQKHSSSFPQPTRSFLAHPLFFSARSSPCKGLARVHTWNTTLASVASWAAQSFPNFYSPLWQLDGKKEIQSMLHKTCTLLSLFASHLWRGKKIYEGLSKVTFNLRWWNKKAERKYLRWKNKKAQGMWNSTLYLVNDTRRKKKMLPFYICF